MRIAKLVLMFAALLCTPHVGAADGLARTAFDKLSALVGNWQGKHARGVTGVNYRLTANNTAIIETWTMSPTRESVTIYTLDGDRLLATHFCPQGNQPRLALTSQDTTGKYQFTFIDGTNLQVKGVSHQHAMWIRMDTPNSFTRSETYVPNGTDPKASLPDEEAMEFRRL
jgi:hypothetical protein